MTRVAIGFGSNVGAREEHIAAALGMLERVVVIESVSSLYETAPMYVEDQAPFLNGVAVGETDFGPFSLVEALKRIEAEVGRTPAVRNGPREIDLDLLIYGSLSLRSSGARPLTVPHPGIAGRRFVLEPLAEAMPDAVVPFVGLVESLLEKADVQSQEVRRVERAAISLQGPQ